VVKPQVLVNGVPREEFEAAQNGNSSPSPPSPSPPSPAPPSPKPPPSSLPLSSVVTPIAVSAPDFNFNVVGDFNPAGLGAGAVNMLSVPQQQPIGITTTNFDFDTSASITAAAGLGAGSATSGADFSSRNSRSWWIGDSQCSCFRNSGYHSRWKHGPWLHSGQHR